MSSKSYMQPLDANFVKEGQGQRGKKQVEDQQDEAKKASEEDEEVKFKPRGEGYTKALEHQDKKDPENDAVKHQEKQDPEKNAVDHEKQKNLDRNAMNLQGKGWAGAKHNQNTLEYDPDAKWKKPDDAEAEAWERKRKGQGYENH